MKGRTYGVSDGRRKPGGLATVDRRCWRDKVTHPGPPSAASSPPSAASSSGSAPPAPTPLRHALQCCQMNFDYNNLNREYLVENV